MATVLVGHVDLVGVLDRHVDDARVTLVDVDADAAEHTLGQALADLDPVVSTVGRLVQTATRSAEVERVGKAHFIVAGGVERVRVGRVHHHVDNADATSFDLGAEHAAPAAPTVRGPVESALVVLGIQMTERGDVDDVRVGRVDDDAPDVVRFRQTHVRPTLSLVGRLVDAVAPVRGARVVRLSGTEIQDARVGRGDRDRADREDVLVVEENLERDSVVGRLPQMPRGGREVVRVRLLTRDRDVDEAPTLTCRSDLSVLEVRQQLFVEVLRRDG